MQLNLLIKIIYIKTKPIMINYEMNDIFGGNLKLVSHFQKLQLFFHQIRINIQ